jgi:hypothetical protein
MHVQNLRALTLTAVAAAFAVLLPWAAFAAAADESAWLDVEGRIQYGYYTEDARSLDTLANQLTTGDTDDSYKNYYAALADYRITLLASAKDPTRARDHAERCVTDATRAVEGKKEFAEGFALESACLAQVARLSPLRAPFSASKSQSQIEKALRLAPRNPRVLLLDALNAYQRAANGVDKDRATGKLKRAVAALESERQDVVHVPGWGLPDAYAYLAHACLDKGDTVAARDALEHALLAAPEFAEARRLMTKITSG